jgi:hypothetical protein
MDREKDEKALSLRLAGKKWDDIADELGYADGVEAMRSVSALLRET